MKPFERDKMYSATDLSEKLRVICVDGPGPWPIVAASADGGLWRFNLDGRAQGRVSVNRLIPEPEAFIGWVNVYAHGFGGNVFSDKKYAMAAAKASNDPGYIETISIHYEVKEQEEGNG